MALRRYHHTHLPAVRKQAILAFIVLLCGLLTLENAPSSAAGFHGQDFYTITGVRSTTEVFSAAGTYRLHDYSMLAPSCDGCKPLEVQANFGAYDQHHFFDVYSRISEPSYVCRVPVQMSSNPDGIPDRVIASEAFSPELPPPQMLTPCRSHTDI